MQLAPDERVRAFIAVPTVEQEGKYVVMVTKNGTIKKTDLMAFKNLRKKGIIAISLGENDDLIDANLTDGSNEILLSAANGMACRFRETDIRPMGRQAAGVRGMKLTDGKGNQISTIVSMSIIKPDDELLVVTANGMGKRTPIGIAENAAEIAAETDNASSDTQADEAQDVDDAVQEADADIEETTDAEETADGIIKNNYRLTHRGTRGVTSVKLRPGDQVVAAIQVEPKSEKEIILTTIQGLMVRLRIADFRLCGRATYGTIVMRLNENDKVAFAALVDELSEEEIAANTAKARENAELAQREAEFEARLQELRQQNTTEGEEDEAEESEANDEQPSGETDDTL